jgi:hypothetical protein
MDLLGIKELRRGAAGDAKSPYAANYDESKAAVYPNLPDPLVLENGKRVTSAKTWWTKRRPEIVEDFDREIYGRVPANLPRVTWEVVSSTQEKNGDVPVVTKKLLGHVDNSAWPQIAVSIDLTLTTPANATGPVPVSWNSASAGCPWRQARGNFPPRLRQFALAMIPHGSSRYWRGAGAMPS